MKYLRLLLFPFALIYGVITLIRNGFYNWGWKTSYSFDIPIIAVGNLSVGGTGKTPQIEYLIRLLQDRYKLATLSRGYKRKSKGFLLAGPAIAVEELGDEPYQFYQKFPNVKVAVDANRVNGIQNLLKQNDSPEIILLDDAFQHRKVKAGMYILLTAYGDLYSDDFVLPMGNLREFACGNTRADLVVVTKCPENLSVKEQQRIAKKLRPKAPEQVFFTSIGYDDALYSASDQISKADMIKQQKLLVAGIAKPKPFFAHLNSGSDQELTYPDHHPFSSEDIANIKSKAQNKSIVTTEKDYVRMKDFFDPHQLYYLPIKTQFLSRQAEFDGAVFKYLTQSQPKK